MGLTGTVLEGLTAAISQDTAYSGGALPWVSLHSDDPGTTGLHEVTAGTGSAGRQAPTFTGTGGTDTLVAGLAFDVTGATVTWIGYWDAQTGGTFLGGFPLIGPGTIAAALSGTPSLLAPTHGLSVDDVVRLFPMPGPAASAVPAGFTADTRYWVIAAPDANHVTLSATSGGSAISPASSAACGMYQDEGVYGGTGTLTFPAPNGVRYVTAS